VDDPQGPVAKIRQVDRVMVSWTTTPGGFDRGETAIGRHDLLQTYRECGLLDRPVPGMDIHLVGRYSTSSSIDTSDSWTPMTPELNITAVPVMLRRLPALSWKVLPTRGRRA
jgi:hypothetical protein